MGKHISTAMTTIAGRQMAERGGKLNDDINGCRGIAIAFFLSLGVWGAIILVSVQVMR